MTSPTDSAAMRNDPVLLAWANARLLKRPEWPGERAELERRIAALRNGTATWLTTDEFLARIAADEDDQ
jgi:hypothetical protein